MTSLSRELVFLILQFLDEEKFKETVHKLEQESGFFFNMKYFEDQVINGEWDEVERYLSGFTKVDDNRYSMKIFFEIRKQKYLEALDKHDRAKGVEILVRDLKVFSAFNEDLYKEITQLLTLENFRENEQLSKYGDTKSARGIMLLELKKLIEANPLFREKLAFPSLKASRLRTLINQSLNWQHQLCKNPRPNPDIKTLFIDHSCGGPPNGTRAPQATTNALVPGLPKTAGFPPLGAHGPFQPSPPGWLTNPTAGVAHSAVSHSTVLSGQGSLAPTPATAALLKRPRTPPTTTLDYQSADSDQVLKRARIQDEMNYAGPSHPQIDDIPKTHARTLIQGSSVTSMDFHPSQQSVLLVGTHSGEISIWEVISREKIAHKSFKVWDINACSVTMQTNFVNGPPVTVNRVVWSPDGSLVGVAFSKFIIHLYMYNGNPDLRQHLEIEAHVGGVNDLAFAHPNKQLCVITCGDDKTIKVWDASTGRKIYVFEGHDAAVYSVCPHYKETIQFIFSTALDGKIKAWLYDNLGSRVDYDAPGRWCTTMAYSADGTRLFSCGTSKERESFLVEWNESEGAIKRTYQGFRTTPASGIVQFDTTKNRFLAAGDENSIKIWDMDNSNLLKTIDADSGVLPATPRLRFNKEGSLLAVSTNDNGFRILANGDGLRMLKTIDSRKADVKGRIVDDKNWKLADLTEQAHCRSIRLTDSLPASKVLRLIYTTAGTALLALGSNAVHKLWKWPKNDWHPSGKATASVAPQLWQPPNVATTFMTNDISDLNNPAESVPCLALSKNDSYVMSASGGKVVLFNMMTFKMMTSFMPPPPAATFLAFHPQDNNVIAIGMEDSTIHIYNVRVDEVKSKLEGHQKRVTGLAFATNANVLVSSGADGQLCLWGTDAWDKKKTRTISIPLGRESNIGDTKVQFDADQSHLLVINETQLAIYDAFKLEPMQEWFPRDPFPAPISHATLSCDSQLVYAAFVDGSVGVFETASFRPRCRLSAATYLPPGVSGTSVFPLVVAAHPSDRHQFALGLSDGGVQVLEPLEPDGKWGPVPLAIENGAASCTAIAPASVAPVSTSVDQNSEAPQAPQQQQQQQQQQQTQQNQQQQNQQPQNQQQQNQQQQPPPPQQNQQQQQQQNQQQQQQNQQQQQQSNARPS